MVIPGPRRAWCIRRYLLRVTISRPYGASVVRDFPFWVRNHRQPEPQASLPPVKVRSFSALERFQFLFLYAWVQAA